MRKCLVLLMVIAGFLCNSRALRAQYISDSIQWNNAETHTAVSVAYMTEREKAMLRELNMVRMYPKRYAVFAETYLKKLHAAAANPPANYYLVVKRETRPGVYVNDTLRGARIYEQEIRAARELIGVLHAAAPLQPLQPDMCLQKVARSHGRYMAELGQLSHTGRDGTAPDERIRKAACKNFLGAGENLAAHNQSIRQTVLDFLLDTHVPSKSHRKNILEPTYTIAGIAETGRLGKFSSAWVIDFMP